MSARAPRLPRSTTGRSDDANRFPVRLNDHEYEILKRLSVERDESMSDVLRGLIREAHARLEDTER